MSYRAYDHFLTRKTQFFTLFMLSRTSDNTNSQNIGGTNAWAVPPPHILGGTVPPVPPRSPPLLARTRGILFHFGTVPGNPGQLVTLYVQVEIRVSVCLS